MTALSQYQRLEAVALWRPSQDEQRREVILSMGDATLTMTDMQGRALTHWSIAALVRANPGQMPAIFHPDGDPGEIIEMAESERDMIDAIEKILRALRKSRANPGKLRFWSLTGIFAALALIIILVVPRLAISYTAKALPLVKHAEIGEALLARMTRVSGRACADPAGVNSLNTMATRLLGPDYRGQIAVLPAGVDSTAHLPGGKILLGRMIVEDFEDPDVVSGYILAEYQRMTAHDPLRDMLDHAGFWATLKLFSTGEMSPTRLDAYAETLLVQDPAPLDRARLLAAFEQAQLRSTPYALAVDTTGETTRDLIENDPLRDQGSRTILSDGNWLRLQNICGG